MAKQARKDDLYEVMILQDTSILVDEDGNIKGPSSEGTLGIILNGGTTQSLEGQAYGVQRAIRIPRMLQADVLLNYHVASTSYYEGRQATRFAERNGVLGASNFLKLDSPNIYTKIPKSNTPKCYIGFFLSPFEQYRVGLVSETECWPTSLQQQLKRNNQSPKDLFQLLEKSNENKVNDFDNLFFLPETGTTSRQNRVMGVLDGVSGKNLDLIEEKGLSGWWFNMPVAVYPWMTTNLERLVTSMLEEDPEKRSTIGSDKLRGWELHNWLTLVKQLTLGLHEIHRNKAVHGDPRPANVMADTPPGCSLTAEGFRWIDIGLGYGAESCASAKKGHTPRPLGGGRSSIFYAPERDEGNEYEDADVAHLEVLEDGSLKLSFYFKERTNEEPQLMYLRNNQTSYKALSELKQGDRLQVREFVFDVDHVEDDGIIVSAVYELVLGRVLVRQEGNQMELVRKRLHYAPISRYQIHYEWSQATDLYSLGIIVLYLFFIRGLHKSNENAKPFDGATREELFAELVGIMRNRCLLESFLQCMKDQHFEDQNSILRPLSEEFSEKKIQDIVEILYAADTNFIYVLRGLNNNYSLFLQLIYFCLSCVWRQQEIDEIIRKADFAFTPFAASRHFNHDNPAEAAQSARVFIEKIMMLYGNTAFDEHRYGEQSLDRINPASRIEQVLKYRSDLDLTIAKLEEVEKELAKAQQEKREMAQKIRSARGYAKNTNLWIRLKGKNLTDIDSILEEVIHIAEVD